MAKTETELMNHSPIPSFFLTARAPAAGRLNHVGLQARQSPDFGVGGVVRIAKIARDLH
jgi:hypothetical protein